LVDHSIEAGNFLIFFQAREIFTGCTCSSVGFPIYMLQVQWLLFFNMQKTNSRVVDDSA